MHQSYFQTSSNHQEHKSDRQVNDAQSKQNKLTKQKQQTLKITKSQACLVKTTTPYSTLLKKKKKKVILKTQNAKQNEQKHT